MKPPNPTVSLLLAGWCFIWMPATILDRAWGQLATQLAIMTLTLVRHQFPWNRRAR